MSNTAQHYVITVSAGHYSTVYKSDQQSTIIHPVEIRSEKVVCSVNSAKTFSIAPGAKMFFSSSQSRQYATVPSSPNLWPCFVASLHHVFLISTLTLVIRVTPLGVLVGFFFFTARFLFEVVLVF